ncbi:hypothetical protein HPB50_018719 [Hyalomma asiaticum]|uniref:Uncharacterized protein n=1 Tax=Hyalomma asiaticum TaxID=266040 RepID=A0ACB7RXA5_HYAAI|nr:hypothetical protein HPB50_018719 [Hyalomma asiaticum]
MTFRTNAATSAITRQQLENSEFVDDLLNRDLGFMRRVRVAMLFSAIALTGIMVAVFIAAPCTGQGHIPVVGGWQTKNVREDPIYEELAHFAISKQVHNRQFFDTVLELLDVQTQVVAGVNYRIKFKTAESTCRITDAYSKVACPPKPGHAAKDVCTAEITDGIASVRSLTSFTCQGSA